jgi:2,4-dienoyl-CoA reductase-like NADH-dependent reductase (Old Yellow Enzyme family)
MSSSRTKKRNEKVNIGMKSKTELLFTSIEIAGVSCKNRLAVAPMSRVTATEDGRATETMSRYYERFSRGGFGMIITEGIYTDQAFAQAYHHQPGITDEAQAQSWKPVVAGIRAHGALAVAQMMHAGATSQGNRHMSSSAGPTALLPKGKPMSFYYGKEAFAQPLAMTEEQIADAIEGFASSAARAIKSSGFDAIEIHGANGYLLDQFLTDYTNQRSDHWGGSTEGRLRLTLAVLKAVKDSVGVPIPVGVRISQGKVNDSLHKWKDEERDADIIFGSLADASVDFIHVTESEARKPAFASSEHTLVHFAKKYAPAAVVIANGNLHVNQQAIAALEDGADIVSFGRAALANPDLPNNLATGSPLKEFDSSILVPIANIKDKELSR